MAGRIVWMIDDWKRDWTTNHAQLSAANSDPGLRPIEINAGMEDVDGMIRAWVQTQSAWSVVSDTNGESDETQSSMRRMHLTRTTPLFRFVDDIHVELTPVETEADSSTRTRVVAESRSRVGKGDLGQNPRNLKALREGLLAQSSDQS
ncbi:hypothetical protein RSSM_02448 [Rhodopirellula sallentina SM41]|uniref:DUF1499 domain-containing protein n=2 Tax=Rhodopirellula TaxID=265488 RepID=M5UJB7_9BACT|nr:hypothetical protein RSSM_02448 [Rhodopirellula sallentina SM41]